MGRLTSRVSNEFVKDEFSYGDYLMLKEPHRGVAQKLGNLEDIEEEMGCPLEVVIKALKNGIYATGFKVKQNPQLLWDEEYGWILQTYECDEFTKNYKKTWWLKANKSK